jgi:hypothetical protein
MTLTLSYMRGRQLLLRELVADRVLAVPGAQTDPRVSTTNGLGLVNNIIQSSSSATVVDRMSLLSSMEQMFYASSTIRRQQQPQRFDSIAHIELAVGVVNLVAHGGGAALAVLRNLFVAVALCELVEQLVLGG